MDATKFHEIFELNVRKRKKKTKCVEIKPYVST